MLPNKHYIVFTHIVLEFLLLNLCLGLVLLLKNPDVSFPITGSILENESFHLALIFNSIWIGIVLMNGNKDVYFIKSSRKRFKYILINTFLFVGVVSTIAILLKIDYFNRTTFLLPIFIFAFLNFFLYSLVLEYFKRKNVNPFDSNVVVIGSGGKWNEMESFSKRIELIGGYQIEGYILDKTTEINSFNSSNVLGGLKDLSQVLQTKNVDEIFIATSNLKEKKVNAILGDADYHGVRVNIVPETPVFNGKVKPVNLEGLPIFQHRQTPLNFFDNALLKRAFDILFSLAVLFFLSPIFLIVALLIFMDNGWGKSVLYKPYRKGEANESFRCLKFRTMSVCDNPKNGTKSTVKNDPRITRIGKFLRKYDLDELPQFINVFKGDMSVVGPRPHRHNLQDDFRKVVNDYMVRHYVKPGVTGWAQVNGWRGPTQTVVQKKERIKHDLWYIENWSFWLDIKIIFKTVFSKKTRMNAF